MFRGLFEIACFALRTYRPFHVDRRDSDRLVSWRGDQPWYVSRFDARAAEFIDIAN